MKRNTSSSVLLFILLYSLNVIKAQAEQVSVFEQEQAQQIANQIIVQKSLSDEKLENVNIDTEDLISRGYDAWANLEFYKAADYFKKAQMLEPYNSEISTLIYKVEQARITFERKKIELQQRIIQDERMLETDKAWLTDNPATKSVGLLQDKLFSQKRLQEKILEKKVSVDFDNAQLEKVIEYLSQTSGVNIIMDEAEVLRAGSVSIRLKDVTLNRALESILRTKGLSYRFEKDFIWISTKENIAAEGLVTRIYHLSQGLGTFTSFTTFDTVTVKSLSGKTNAADYSKSDAKTDTKTTQESTGQDTYEGVKIGGPGGVKGQVTSTVQDVLRDFVPWPEGSRIFLDNRTSTLIVRNTPSNLDVIEDVILALDVNPPQVMIEARFVEIGEDDLFSLGLKLSSEISAEGATAGTTYPFNKNEDNKYMAAFPAMSADEFGFGKLDFSQFQAVLSAIEQNASSNTLSSPKITTISGQEAIIKIVKEYRYPTKYEIQSYDAVANGQTRTYYATVPSEFKTRDIGIILKVIPNVGADGKTINLTLIPEVSEFDIDKDMYNFGTETQPYLQPFFDTRSCVASIIVNNNDTVVMGGLMREVADSSIDRVPVLGKLPILGTLFTRKHDNKVKRNLLIFVTAKIIAPTGEDIK